MPLLPNQACACCLIRPAARGGLRRPSAEWQRRQAAALRAKSQPLSMFNTAHPCQLAAILENPSPKRASSPGAAQTATNERPQQPLQQAGASCSGAAAEHGSPASSSPAEAASSTADKAGVGGGSAKAGAIGITAAVPLPHVVYTGNGDSKEGTT